MGKENQSVVLDYIHRFTVLYLQAKNLENLNLNRVRRRNQVLVYVSLIRTKC